MNKRKKTSGLARVIKLAIFSFLPLFVLIFVGECGQRSRMYWQTGDKKFLFYGLDLLARSFTSDREINQLKTIPVKKSELAAEKDENGAYYWDIYYEFKKPEHTLRIITLGGSATYSGGYGRENSYPGMLESLFSAALDSLGIAVQVINMGQHGLATDKFRIILEKGLPFDPDLVILYCGFNDALKRQVKIYTSPLEVLGIKLSFRFYGYSLLYASLYDKIAFSTTHKPEYKEATRKDFVRNVEHVLASCDSVKLPVLIVPEVAQNENEDTKIAAFYEIYLTLIKELEKIRSENNCMYVTVREELYSDIPKFFSDAVHLYPPGRRVLAGKIFSYLIESVWMKQKIACLRSN